MEERVKKLITRKEMDITRLKEELKVKEMTSNKYEEMLKK